MRAIALGMVVSLLGWAAPSAAQEVTSATGMLVIYSGKCSADSHRAGKRFKCDSVMSVEGKPGDLMLIFLHTSGPDDAVLGVEGSIAEDGSLIVEQVQLKPGERRNFDGRCEIKRNGPQITAVRCTATEQDGKRSVMIHAPQLTEFRP